MICNVYTYIKMLLLYTYIHNFHTPIFSYSVSIAYVNFFLLHCCCYTYFIVFHPCLSKRKAPQCVVAVLHFLCHCQVLYTMVQRNKMFSSLQTDRTSCKMPSSSSDVLDTAACLWLESLFLMAASRVTKNCKHHHLL